MALTVDQFMAALSGQESGGSYTAQNGRTGAYGRFQIMPANWPSWSREAGIPGAAQTPENQEKVARYKLQQYFDKFGNWEDVASAWYSGSPMSAYTPAQLDRPQGNGDEPSIRQYVQSVMGRAGVSGSDEYNPSTPPPPVSIEGALNSLRPDELPDISNRSADPNVLKSQILDIQTKRTGSLYSYLDGHPDFTLETAAGVGGSKRITVYKTTTQHTGNFTTIEAGSPYIGKMNPETNEPFKVGDIFGGDEDGEGGRPGRDAARERGPGGHRPGEHGRYSRRGQVVLRRRRRS
jgi:hypothetical protein